MVTFLLRRLAFMAVTLFAVSILVFGVSRASGDPRYTAMFQFSKGITKENWDALGELYGLDKPLVVQYLIWAGNALRGDLGTSFAGKRPVSTVILEKVQPTAELAILATVFAVAIGIPLGVLSAVRRGNYIRLPGTLLRGRWAGGPALLVRAGVDSYLHRVAGVAPGGPSERAGTPTSCRC